MKISRVLQNSYDNDELHSAKHYPWLSHVDLFVFRAIFSIYVKIFSVKESTTSRRIL